MLDRRHPRYAIVAQVELTVEGEVRVFIATNVSQGGMFFEGDPAEHADILPGMCLPLTLSLGNEEDEDDDGPPAELPPPLAVHAVVRIVHRTPGTRTRKAGFGVSFEEIDGENQDALRHMLSVVAGHGG